MQLGIIITQTDPETVFNALRLAQTTHRRARASDRARQAITLRRDAF